MIDEVLRFKGSKIRTEGSATMQKRDGGSDYCHFVGLCSTCKEEATCEGGGCSRSGAARLHRTETEFCGTFLLVLQGLLRPVRRPPSC